MQDTKSKEAECRKTTLNNANAMGLQYRITANDLGKVKFLFNFTSEEDLMYVLQKGPFHYNYCMFVLVTWELVVGTEIRTVDFRLN